MDDGTGFIYIVELTERSNIYKVGSTNNMYNRLQTLRRTHTLGDENTKNGGIYLKFLSFARDKSKIERLVHSVFHEYSYCEQLKTDVWSLRGDELYELAGDKEYEDLKRFIIENGGDDTHKLVYEQLNQIPKKYGGLK